MTDNLRTRVCSPAGPRQPYSTEFSLVGRSRSYSNLRDVRHRVSALRLPHTEAESTRPHSSISTTDRVIDPFRGKSGPEPRAVEPGRLSTRWLDGGEAEPVRPGDLLDGHMPKRAASPPLPRTPWNFGDP